MIDLSQKRPRQMAGPDIDKNQGKLLADFPDIVGLEELREVVVLLLG